MPLAEVLIGAAAAAVVGRSALPRGRGSSASALAEDFVLGISLLAPAALFWGIAGLPWSPVAVPALALGLAAPLFLAGRRRKSPPPSRLPSEGSLTVSLATEALLGLCFLVSAWKWDRVRLWSWDHYAIWGLKARRLVQDSALDLRFLELRPYVSSNPDYPIGLPLTWRFLSPSDPSEAAFKLCHLLFAAVLVLGLHGAVRRLGGSRSLAALVAAGVCASPLFWDTEAVGLADLPLAVVAVVAVLLALEASTEPRFPAWAAGVGLGFLAWIKTEGLVLGTALAVACAVLVGAGARQSRFRRRAALLAPWLLWSLGAILTRLFLLGKGVGFFEGDWLGRVRARLPATGVILSAMLEDLSGPEWLGLWALFGVAGVASFVRKAPVPRLLSGVVVTLFGSYAFVYLGTFLDPLRHVESSFHRLAAALAPLAALTIAVSVAPSAPAERNRAISR